MQQDGCIGWIVALLRCCQLRFLFFRLQTKPHKVFSDMLPRAAAQPGDMEKVARVVKELFWTAALNSVPFPSAETLKRSPHTVSALAGMTGTERKCVLIELNVAPRLVVYFLRAIQHLTALHSRETVEDPSFLCHRFQSAQHWAPIPPQDSSHTAFTSLLGHPMSLSNDRVVGPEMPRGPATASITVSEPATFSTFAGLRNQGSTCYLNSMLQALYHLTKFRATIYNISTSDAPSTSSRSIPLALQRLFCNLQSSSGPVSTNELTSSFGWSDADSFIQHDIHELTRILLDNLEEKIERQNRGEPASPAAATPMSFHNCSTASLDNSEPNAIRELFQGTQENFISVQDADYYGSRDEHFYDIQVVVKGKKNIYESFDAMVEVEVLDGKNKYCLERDGKKSYHRAEKGVRFKRLPPVLLLHLARFDYDPEKGDMCKVLSRWEYYDKLDLTRYMCDDARSNHPPSYFRYRLHSVLVHSGSDARFGHYYCYVKCEAHERSPQDAPHSAGRWYKFNDEMVSEASCGDVFGANFGGSRLNYWGTEVPMTMSAYMLMYLREAALDSLLTPVSVDAVPSHVKHQLEAEAQRAEERKKERAEAHLYGTVHFIGIEDLEEHPVLLVKQAPLLQFPPHRALRTLLTNDALSTFLPFAAKMFGVEDEQDVALWVVYDVDSAADSSSSCLYRIGRRVVANTAVREYCKERETDGYRETCVFVTLAEGSTPLLRPPDDNFPNRISSTSSLVASARRAVRDHSALLTIHKFYDPFHLKIRFVDAIPLSCGRPVSELVPLVAAKLVEQGFVSSVDCQLKIALEEQGPTFIDVTQSSTSVPYSGSVYVWQEVIADSKRAPYVLYSTLAELQRAMKHRVPVDICRLLMPTCPRLMSAELPDEMPYEQLQRFVAYHIGEPEFDKVRFSRHNPDTKSPYFMKNKKSAGTTLRTLLTVPNQQKLNSIVYTEVCPYTVTEIEQSNSFQFEWFDAHLRPSGQYWLLLPDVVPMLDLLSQVAHCVNRGLHLHARSEDPSLSTSSTTSPSPKTSTAPIAMDAAHLRIVDVWKSRIYNCYDLHNPITARFEESAEYRVEASPEPLANIPAADQVLLHCFHFSRGSGGKVQTHSDPFSLYFSLLDSSETVRERVCAKLQLNEQQVEDWKFSFVHGNRVVEIKASALFGEQLFAFAKLCSPLVTPPATTKKHVDPNASCTLGGNSTSLSVFQSNQKEGTQTAFIGLEHAAATSTRRGVRREERSLKIFN